MQLIFLKKGECKEDIFVDVGPHLKKSFEVKNDFLINLKNSKLIQINISHQ